VASLAGCWDTELGKSFVAQRIHAH
jgi:hypothetical protein